MTIKNFRRGRRTQHTNQFVLVHDSVDSKTKAAKLIGSKAEWKTSSGKIIKGKITRIHGGKGAVIARMEKGLPGTAISTKMNVIEKKTTAKTKTTAKKEKKKQ
ncbi:MAG: 50S ribosomal protein L35ae [Candidatus Micrarchaeota archaeon]